MDNLLLITLLTIFAAAFIGTIIRYRVRDKCLKGFEDYFVTLEQQDGKRVWGELKVYHNGLELLYPSPHLDPDGDHYETSHILFQNQYNTLFALKRHHDELSEDNQRRREKELKQTYHPNIFRRTGRSLRNMFNLLRDAFGQAVSVFIGHMKKAGTSTFVSTQDAKLQDTAKSLLGATASAYEPILENYIGRKVVLEVTLNDKKHEFCGVLREYTDSFVCLLNVPVGEEHEFNLSNPKQLEVNKQLDFEVASEPAAEGESINLHLTVTNKGDKAVHICHAEGSEYSHRVDKDLEPGTALEFELPNVPIPKLDPPVDAADVEAEQASETASDTQNVLPDLRLWIRARRFMDMVVPRSLGFVRHGAESIGHTNVKFSLRLKTP